MGCGVIIMSYTYKYLKTDPFFGDIRYIERSDGAQFIADADNYIGEGYREWVAAGNTAEAAD